jgi:hypothetical protein
MDVFAHTLWTSALAKEANKAGENKNFHLSVGWAAFWGVFPDLFAFTIPFVLRFYNAIFGDGSSFFSRPELEGGSLPQGFDLAHTLYNYSHSLVIWALVFILVWIYFKRPRYELLGWALHILIDIPSHVLAFFPTPFLFPLSDYRFPYGVSWGNYWYMLINYSLLLIVWGRILLQKMK